MAKKIKIEPSISPQKLKNLALNITKSINGVSNLKETYSNDMTSDNNNDIVNNSSSSSTSNHTNRNSSSNAILAHLKSLSPNFKSIFVRPKSSKQIGMIII